MYSEKFKKTWGTSTLGDSGTWGTLFICAPTPPPPPTMGHTDMYTQLQGSILEYHLV